LEIGKPVSEENRKHRLSKLQKEMIAALEKTGLNVALACTMVTTGRTVHYKWIENNPKYKAAIEEIHESLIDLAESKLIINVKKGDQKAIQYMLDSKGKARGYGKAKIELSTEDGKPLEHSHTVTPEEIKQARKVMNEHFK
jgi:hypothetical protein